MRRLTTTAAAAAALALATPAFAQPRQPDRDRRDREHRRDRDERRNDRDHRDRGDRGKPLVRGMSPDSGPPGTAVTIIGANLPRDAVILVGRRKVKPGSALPRRIQFEIPKRMRPGKQRITMAWGGETITLGHFEVTGARRGDDRAYEPPVAGGPGPDRRPRGDRRRPPRYHREQVVVSSFWPRKGAPGTKVTIRGNNFPGETRVMFGDRAIKPDRAGDKQIVFTIPRGAKDELIRLRVAGTRRDVVAGRFEVAERYDPRAERRRIEAERRKKAEAYWARRQKELGRDRAKRRAWLEERERQLEAARARRRAQARARLRAKWKREFLRDPQTRAELSLHAERMARLERMRRLAEANGSGKLVVRIEIVMDRESSRHERRMDALEAAFKI